MDSIPGFLQAKGPSAGGSGGIAMDMEAETEGGVLAPIDERPEDWARDFEPKRSMVGQVLRLSAPVLVEQVLQYLVYISDTVLTGRYLDEEALAAVAVSTYLPWFLGSLMTIISVGATTLVARMTGANEPGSANRVCQQAIGLALIFGGITLVAGEVLAPGLVRVLNLEGEAARDATVFLRVLLLVTPLLAVTSAGIACLRGVGDTRTGMWVMMGVNAVNVSLAWAFVRGLGPIPALGFPGIAIGTATSEAIGGLVVLIVLARGRSGLKLGLSSLVPRVADAWRILRISLPAAAESLTNVFCQLGFLGMINSLGPTATAAHGVAIRCEALAFLTVTAFSIAASTLTGQYLGAGRPDLAAKAGRVAWGMGVATLAVIGVILFFAGGPMFELFLGGKQPAVVAEGVPVLRIVAFALPFLATMNVLTGALRGAGDTRWPWVIVMVGQFGFRLPLTFALTLPIARGGFGLGLQGAWLAMFADLAARGILVAARFLHGGWKDARV